MKWEIYAIWFLANLLSLAHNLFNLISHGLFNCFAGIFQLFCSCFPRYSYYLHYIIKDLPDSIPHSHFVFAVELHWRYLRWFFIWLQNVQWFVPYTLHIFLIIIENYQYVLECLGLWHIFFISYLYLSIIFFALLLVVSCAVQAHLCVQWNKCLPHYTYENKHNVIFLSL